jgi:hypothetical protein
LAISQRIKMSVLNKSARKDSQSVQPEVMSPRLTMEDHRIDDPNSRLKEMGYDQELRRSLGMVSVLGLSFAIMAVPFGLSTSMLRYPLRGLTIVLMPLSPSNSTKYRINEWRTGHDHLGLDLCLSHFRGDRCESGGDLLRVPDVWRSLL